MPQAEQELEDIAYYIAQDNPDRAIKFVRSLIAFFRKILSVYPESGVLYKSDIRKITYKHYTAFYFVDKKQHCVNIIHIVNLGKPLSARDINL